MPSSRLPGFHALDREARLAEIVRAAGLSNEEAAYLADAAAHDGALADNLSENVISAISVPLGIATNMIVDGNTGEVTQRFAITLMTPEGSYESLEPLPLDLLAERLVVRLAGKLSVDPTELVFTLEAAEFQGLDAWSAPVKNLE